MNTTTLTTQNYANQIGYSDVSPFEIVRRVSEKVIEIRPMTAERDKTVKLDFQVGGFMAHCSNQDDQKWTITSDPAAEVRRIRLHKDGWWRDSGRNRYRLAAEPRRFYDFNF